MTAAVGLSPKVETNEVQQASEVASSLYDAWKRRFFRGGRRFGFFGQVWFGIWHAGDMSRDARAWSYLFTATSQLSIGHRKIGIRCKQLLVIAKD